MVERDAEPIIEINKVCVDCRGCDKLPFCEFIGILIQIPEIDGYIQLPVYKLLISIALMRETSCMSLPSSHTEEGFFRFSSDMEYGSCFTDGCAILALCATVTGIIFAIIVSTIPFTVMDVSIFTLIVNNSAI
jgi:hypothetical protein